MNAVKHNYSQDFSYVYGLNKLDLLKKRYMCFSWMLGIEHVNYVAEKNVVTAPPHVWKAILKVYVSLCLS